MIKQFDVIKYRFKIISILVDRDGLEKKFAGKRQIVLITIKDFKEIEPFKMDRPDYGNMDDWLPVEMPNAPYSNRRQQC